MTDWKQMRVNNEYFLGPVIEHLEKDAFLFSRFVSEMVTHGPAISNLKTIETDLEKTIFHSFLF